MIKLNLETARYYGENVWATSEECKHLDKGPGIFCTHGSKQCEDCPVEGSNVCHTCPFVTKTPCKFFKHQRECSNYGGNNGN